MIIRNPATPQPRNRRIVVFAGRTSQALARLRYDVEPLFAGDDRLDIRYALIPGSRFASGAPDFASRNGIDLLPWEDARELPPNLVVTSSPDPCLYEAAAPVISIPHGAGHNRLRPELSGASGLSPEQIRGPAGQVPDLLALPGPAAARRLAIDCPEALPGAEVCGDVCFERFRASAALRDRYRDALGVGPDRRLVLLSSSWDRTALAHQDMTLAERLYTQLPADEFAFAYIPHPNDDLTEAPRATGALRPYVANGLIMVPPDEGWRAALLAADCLIGDHGSVTFFGAALGVPTLLAFFGFANMPADLPLARFGRTAPRLDREAPAAPQIRTAIASGPLAFDFQDALAEPNPGPSALLHAAAYRFLSLPTPKPPAPQPIPLPAAVPGHRPTASWRAVPTAAGWDRFPVSIPETGPRDGHLVADLTAADDRLKSAANVLLHHSDKVDAAAASAVATKALRDYPVSRIVSVLMRPWSQHGESTARITIRDGLTFAVDARQDQIELIPSCLYEALAQLGPDPVRVGVAEVLEHLQRRFEPAPRVRAVE